MANVNETPDYVVISGKEFEALQKGLPNWRTDWDAAKGRVIAIRQLTKEGYLYRALLALDYVPFEEYKKSCIHSFIILE